MGNIGFWELLVILIVALLVFGRRLPEVSRSMGKAIRQFKDGLRDLEDKVEKETLEEGGQDSRDAAGRDDGSPDENQPPSTTMAG